MQTIPFQFYDEAIEVTFTETPKYEKAPGCPQAFQWREQSYQILEVMEEWMDTRRRGKFDRNMSTEHLAIARLRGSWGVGRYYFRVKVNTGQFFEIYYDRSPDNCDDRKGGWYLLGERKPGESQVN